MSLVWGAGLFAAAIVEKLVNKLCSYIREEYQYKANIKPKLRSLEEDLKMIQSVLHAAEQRSIESVPLKEWLQDLKDAAHDAESILCIFQGKVDEGKSKETAGQASIDPPLKRRRTEAKVHRFSSNDLNKFDDVVDRFKLIVKDMGSLVQLLSLECADNEKEVQAEEQRYMKSMASEPQRTHLIKLLLEVGGTDGASTSKIVGTECAGKIGLAWDAYNDPSVREYFDVRVWVCGCDDFDAKRIAGEIKESASIHEIDDDDDDDCSGIQEILESELKGKKFLVVLEDVQDVVAKKREILQSILNLGKEGSRIVITT